MGYYTRYTLEVEANGEDLESIRDAIVSESYEMRASELIDDMTDDMKWYDHEEDMKDFSKKFPKAVFTLKGEGEESPDTWVSYFQNGKCQEGKTEIVYEKFDPKKLR